MNEETFESETDAMPSVAVQSVLAVYLLVALFFILPRDADSCPRRVKGAFSKRVPKPPSPPATKYETQAMAQQLKRLKEAGKVKVVNMKQQNAFSKNPTPNFNSAPKPPAMASGFQDAVKMMSNDKTR
ncbi:hypothetical protein BOX15_Mlig027608g1 [Macrostomum lignano]|uniref:Uncharacterized protein n=1 Tax=Macrostomum lignano TaxID=282301 RepID=A0A267GWJ7_9PLAT|nr:hypothetical protein BOX15_Mlig027608g1 [Macrostomum lignano]